MKNKVVVDISDAKFSTDPRDVLITYSLGSCIGVSVYDPVTKIGGMLHYQLPESKIDAEKAQRHPCMFADTGMAYLVNSLLKLGANKKRLKVKICGGASMNGSPQGFDIGNRNHLALRKVLWKNAMFIDKEDVGGSSPRNMYLDIETGTVNVKSAGNSMTL